MHQIVNESPFLAHLMILPNEQGVECAYAIVKGTFSMGSGLAIVEDQSPLVPADVFWGEPGVSSLKEASDFCLAKPSTDLVMVGSAHAPRGEPTTQVDVRLTVGSLSKTVRVFGDRVWQEGWFSTKPSTPQSFVQLPLTYERAFGGTDQSKLESGVVEAESRNPVGKGFRGRKSGLPIDGASLPNLEDPAQLIGKPSDRPNPCCFGAVCGHWEPRRSFAGTYDEAWQKGRAPYLPLDFDARFFNVAHPDLVSPTFLTGRTPVEIENATPDGLVRFQIPEVRPLVVYTVDGVEIAHSPNLDTVTIEPELNRFSLVWRAVEPCDKKTLKVRQILVAVDH